MKKVFITGGSTGIGYELAKQYIRDGWKVGVCGRDASKVDPKFKGNKNFLFYTVDVVDKVKLIEAVKEFSGDKLDLMIANAGISLGNKSKIPDFERARTLFDINIKGVLNAIDAALPLMLPHKSGQLVAVASVAGFVGLPGAASYSASKAAVIKMCESFAIDLKPLGINVTTICPGFIDTPLTRVNPHPMPFIMSGEKGARKIKGAIEKRKALYVFPWSMKFVIYILALMPRFMYRAIMGFKFFDFSKDKK